MKEAKTKRERELQKEQLFEFINLGAQEIIEGRYEEAFGYFNNSSMAESFGFNLVLNRFIILSETPGLKKIEKLAHGLAQGSYGPSRRNDSRSIGLAEFYPYDGVKVPLVLLHEKALLSLEEWLHALQYLSEKPIAGYENAEIDVAWYMKERGIPMTEYFLYRYGRKEALQNEKE